MIFGFNIDHKDQEVRVCVCLIEYGIIYCRIIVDRIDKDSDGEVTQEELVVWVKHVSRR